MEPLLHAARAPWQLTRGDRNNTKYLSVTVRKRIHARKRHRVAISAIAAVDSRVSDRRGFATRVGVCEVPTAAAVDRVVTLYLRCPSEIGVGRDLAHGVIPVGDQAIRAGGAGNIVEELGLRAVVERVIQQSVCL